MAINVIVDEGTNDVVQVDVALAYPSHTHTVTDITNVAEDIQDLVGAMVTTNTESGIDVTYDDTTGKLNFNVGDFTLTLDGDVSGTGTVTNLANATITTTVADNSHNHVSTNITDFTEAVQDAAQAMVVAATHSGLTVSYDDILNTLTFNVNDPVISIAGDATGSATMTNLGNTEITIDLSDTGVTAATYGDANSVSQFAVDVDGRITSASSVDIAIPSTQVTDFTEAVQDSAAPLLNHAGHTNVTASYDDVTNKITLIGAGNVLSVNGETGVVTLTTGDIAEGNDGDPATTNLWFTDDRAKDSAGALINGATKTGISTEYNSTTNALTLSNTGILSINGTTNQIVATTSNGITTVGLATDVTIPNNLTVTGNLSVLGTETIFNAGTITTEDTTILVNSAQTGTPANTLKSGIEVARGDLTNAILAWSEADQQFAWSNSGGDSYKVLSQVDSVNGFIGGVVLDTDDIAETATPTNLWYTDPRVDNRVLSYYGTTHPSITTGMALGATAGSPLIFESEVNFAPKTKVYVRNNTASDINAGSAVYISGYATGSTVPNIALADSLNPTKMPAIGILEDTILASTNGYVTTQGLIQADTFDITSAVVGSEIFVANSGTLSISQQEASRKTQRIGIVVKLSSEAQELDGFIYLYGAGQIELAPSLPFNHFYLGGESTISSEPVLFSIENILTEGYADAASLPSTSLGGSFGYVIDTGTLHIKSGSVWKQLTYLGHQHTSSDITNFPEAVNDQIDNFFLDQLNLFGLNYVYSDLENIGTLAVRDVTFDLNFTGDVEGSATVIQSAAGDVEFTVPLTLNGLQTSAFIFDTMDHIHHENVVVDYVAEDPITGLPEIQIKIPTPKTQEEIQDWVAPLLNHTNHTNVTVTYDDGPNQLLLSVPDSVDLIQFGTRPAVNGNVTVGLLDITSALGYTPIGNTQTEVVTDLVAPSLVHDNHVNLVAVYDDDSDRIVFEVQTAGAASVGSLTNSWWLGA
jgi:hypothetical protein